MAKLGKRQVEVLQQIATRPGRHTLVARRGWQSTDVGWPSTRYYAVVDRLEALGLISESSSCDYRDDRHVEITPAGRAALAEQEQAK